MSPAVASFNDAPDFEEPRRKAPRKPRAAKKSGHRKGKTPRRFAFDTQRVARYGAIGLSATIALAIAVNALVLQKGHHPAPLFGKSIALGPTPTRSDEAPSVQRAALDAEAAPAPAPAPATRGAEPAARHAEEDAPRSSTGADDPIGALIAGRVPPPAAAKDESHTVLGAQRALAKLGFALKPNGTLGPQTRKAIESFERDHHLPVKGELTHRVVKMLSSESGVRID